MLDERARELAHVPETGSHERRPFVGFRAGSQRYLLPLAAIQQIVPSGPIARLPRAAPGLVGVTNVRGTLLPVLTVEATGTEADTGAWFLVLDGDGDPFAFVVDELSGVVELAPADVRGTRGGGQADLAVVGVTSDGAAIIDVDALLHEGRSTLVPHRRSEDGS